MKRSEYLPSDARLIPPEAKRVFSGVIFDTYQWQQKLYDGSYETFEMLKRPDTVLIFALLDDGSVLAVDEEQPGGIVRRSQLPAGRVDEKDKSIIEAAKRELVEETGYRFKNWQVIETTQPQQKIEWFVHLVLATDMLEIVEQNLDSGEKIKVKAIRPSEVTKHELFSKYPSLSDNIAIYKKR